MKLTNRWILASFVAFALSACTGGQQAEEAAMETGTTKTTQEDPGTTTQEPGTTTEEPGMMPSPMTTPMTEGDSGM